jgi:hypothetical protein
VAIRCILILKHPKSNERIIMKAGFAQVDISPIKFPVRTYLGQVNEIIDPIYANAAVFCDGDLTFAFVSLDVVIVEAEYAGQICAIASAATGIPANRIMVCATHNHACPAIVDRPGHLKELEYIQYMIEKAAEAVETANANFEDVEIGSGSKFESRISFNRRFITHDGTVISQANSAQKERILCNEGVIDPEVGVLAAKNTKGRIIGVMVNFACHACHQMGQVSAGFPGVLSRKIKKAYGDTTVCVYLNGACGNIIHNNYLDPECDLSKEKTGKNLAQTVKKVMAELDFIPNAKLAVTDAVVRIKYRPLDELEDKLAHPEKMINIFKGIHRLGWYDYSLELLRKLHAQADGEDAVIQAVAIGDTVFSSVPAEYFTEHGLRIKLESPWRKTYVISLANGWLGYIPTIEAFSRDGGHETTQALWSKMEYEAGDIMADKAIELIKQVIK